MRIYNIVLTGGPCAGKTTALKSIKRYLEERDIPCIIVKETATELIESGLIPSNNIFEFQKLVMQRQLEKERKAKEEAKIELNKHSYYDKCVIIYDRGLFDNRAYLDTESDFKKLLDMYNIDEINYLERYDLVLNLLSLATCKPEAYIGDNIRLESIEEARRLDRKTSLCWINHHNLKVVSSKDIIERETQLILNYIASLIDGKEETYIDRYEVDKESSSLDKYFSYGNYALFEEYYINIGDPKYIAKVTKKKLNNEETYIIEIYKESRGVRESAYNKIISKEKVRELFSEYSIYDVIDKRVVSFINDQHLFRLWEDEIGKVVLESIKINPDEEIKIPEDIEINKDAIVTPGGITIRKMKKLLR